jgi:hypothetical protein
MKNQIEKDSSSCEVCDKKLAIAGVNEFHKDGTIKIHYTCSNHILDIYNKIEIENNKVKENLVVNISIN